MKPLAGQVGLVTGGSRGIGRAIAIKLAAQGAVVHLTYRSQAALALETVSLIEMAGGLASAHPLDATDSDACDSVIAHVLGASGRLDFLVANAGVTRDGLAVRMSDAAWNDTISANLTGAFHVCRAALRYMMRARQGRIVLISSVVAIGGNPGQANYAASKAGMIGLAKSLAKEYATRGIRVNAVAPGLIETDMTREMIGRSESALLAQIPLGRVGTPEEVAGAVAFLVGPDAGYITGQVLPVCGGMST